MVPRLARTAAVALLAAMVVLGLGDLYFRTFSPDRGRYPMRGIDVSHHQGAIDWQRVAADDVAFAIIKATEGGDHRDENFATNLHRAREAGLTVGAYHFFTFCRSGLEQADNFMATVPRDQPLLPPVVDVEYEGNCQGRPSPEALSIELEAYLEAVEAAFGQEVVLYVTGGAYLAYRHVLPDRPFWTRWIAWHPGNEDWIYWQYHDQGRVDGIEGDVDLNVLQGGTETLEALVVRRRQ